MKRDYSVVIPTIGRPSLAAALSSLADQTAPPREVIVVVDRIDALERVQSYCEASGLVPEVVLREPDSAASTRALGTSRVTSEVVAYLDDDDLWLRDKAEFQLERLGHSEMLVSSRAESVELASGRVSGPIPKTVFVEGEDLPEWMFYRRRLSVGRNVMVTSTLLLPTSIAKKAGWPALVRHQDWGFLLGLWRLEVPITQLRQVLVRFEVGAVGSVTHLDDWRTSLAFADTWKEVMGDRSYIDFAVGQSLRYALQGRSAAGVSAVWSRCWAERRVPSLNALSLAAGGVVPRRTFDSLVHRS